MAQGLKMKGAEPLQMRLEGLTQWGEVAQTWGDGEKIEILVVGRECLAQIYERAPVA